MGQDTRDLLAVLREELSFLRMGGYAHSDDWRPSFIFEDSPTCLQRFLLDPKPDCADCLLTELVPENRRGKQIPCRNIPLNEQGETLESLCRASSSAELLSIAEAWLVTKERKTT